MNQADYNKMAENAARISLINYERLVGLIGWLQEYIKTTSAHSQWQTESILKSQIDIMGETKKTPWKRLDELEQTLKGFISYYYEEKGKPSPKEKNILI